MRAASAPTVGPAERSTEHDGPATLHEHEVPTPTTLRPTQQIRIKAGGGGKPSRKFTQDEKHGVAVRHIDPRALANDRQADRQREQERDADIAGAMDNVRR
jgi:hypothetical protein